VSKPKGNVTYRERDPGARHGHEGARIVWAGREWQGRCRCGWRGSRRARPHDAAGDVVAHKRSGA
jgi:hypothetical protein